MDKDYHVECYHCEVGQKHITCLCYKPENEALHLKTRMFVIQGCSESLIKRNHYEKISDLNYSLSGNYVLLSGAGMQHLIIPVSSFYSNASPFFLFFFFLPKAD